ncbi:hypothetical protein M9Y10_026482 [Tritrichomonas musculus]|uniref:Protein kinase domain-containing protein n=1 Tax=Tritrichomonas musculus TaxID=1915356 RepID=A0ABR2GN00_9EUKA
MIHMQTFKGSPVYMAPEVIMDEEYNYKTDVYSYSIIFYEVFSGKSPYTGYKSIYRLLDDVKNGKRPNLNHIVNEDIKNFLNRCWSSNPTERPTFAEIVEQMKSERYLQIFEVDDEFANKYLILFNDQINSEKNNLIDIETLKCKSNSGDAESILKYSDYLIKIDLIKAAQYLKLAADKGNAEAMSRYALMLKRGQGFSAPNPEMAVFYFKRAIDKGSVRAMQQYANMLMYGDGTPPNPEEAVHYYKMAIDLGDAASMNNYGYMLLHGNGIETNKELASRYFKMAIDLGDTASMNNYGDMLSHGRGIKADKEMAVHYYKMAADKGDRRGIHNYAFMLLKGWGIPENKEEAVKLFKQAADMGYVKSYRFYADIVKNCVGNVVGNAKEASRYYKMAADKGDEMAMVKYASMLESGDGINADLEKAIQYYKKAADLGNKSAKNRYKILTK